MNAELSDALNGRIATEHAKGSVAERAGVDIETAFSKMRQFAAQAMSEASLGSASRFQRTIRAEPRVCLR